MARGDKGFAKMKARVDKMKKETEEAERIVREEDGMHLTRKQLRLLGYGRKLGRR